MCKCSFSHFGDKLVFFKKDGETRTEYLRRIRDKMFATKKPIHRKNREDYQTSGQRDDIVDIIIEKMVNVQSINELPRREYSRLVASAETVLGTVLEEYLRENIGREFLYVDGIVRNVDFVDAGFKRCIQMKGTEGTCNSTTLKAAKDNGISIEYYVDKYRNFMFDDLNETFNTTRLSYQKFKNFVEKYPVEE